MGGGVCSDDDIGKPKAEVAASFINDRVAGCNVTPYPSHLLSLSLSFGALIHCFTAISCAIVSVK